MWSLSQQYLEYPSSQQAWDMWAVILLTLLALQNLVFLLKKSSVEGIMLIFSSKLYFLTESPSIRISYLFFFSLWKKTHNWHFICNINCNVYRVIDALLSEEILALPQHLWLDCYLVTIPRHTDFPLISNYCITSVENCLLALLCSDF